MARSILLGIEALQEADIDACLIALADMPLVSRNHFMELLANYDQPGGITLVATAGNHGAQVPAIFGKQHFPALKTLTGDQGARGLLRDALRISCDPGMLVDFDEPKDFSR